jgi:hypothetical protein
MSSRLIFLPPTLKIRGHIVFVLSVILSFCHLPKTLTLAITFECLLSARALIFHMSCDKTFPWVPKILTL